MQKNDLIRHNSTILRILSINDSKALVIDCIKRNMPHWCNVTAIESLTPCTEQELAKQTDVELFDIESLDAATRKIVHDRYTIIAGVLPFISDDKMRSLVITRIADGHDICKQTVRNYLCLYLAYQNISALAPKRNKEDKPLTRDEKNMRWALNKFFYTKNQNSLTTAYTLMLKEKYSDSNGILLLEFPTFNQFRYFYRKHIGADGFIDWIDNDMDTRYNPIKILAQNHSLFYVNQKLLMWRYPPEIFSLFEKIYIMTYLFPASILKYYFDFCKIPYRTKSIQRLDGKYDLCDYYIPDKSDIKKRIHIYGKSDLNDCFPQKPTALSANWFKNPGNAGKVKILKNNVYNYFMNKEPAKSEEIIWTTFKDSKSKLKGKGYSTRFLSCNCRATNEYADATHLCYCLNVYPHVGVSQFFSQNGIEMDYDLYALSEMLQWIWRSKIRNDGEIYIYIPSKRMRRLLIDWLDNKCQ